MHFLFLCLCVFLYLICSVFLSFDQVFNVFLCCLAYFFPFPKKCPIYAYVYLESLFVLVCFYSHNSEQTGNWRQLVTSVVKTDSYSVFSPLNAALFKTNNENFTLGTQKNFWLKCKLNRVRALSRSTCR